MVIVEQKEQLMKYKYSEDIQQMTYNDIAKFIKDY